MSATVLVRAADVVVCLGRRRHRLVVATRGPITPAELEAAALAAASADQLAEHGRGPLAQPSKEDRP